MNMSEVEMKGDAKRHETLIGRIFGWVNNMVNARRERKAKALDAAMEEECNRELQVREWNGGLYICHNGVPLIHQDFLKENAVVVVKQSRYALKLWKEGTL
jgi:hypothetical protein